MPPPAIRDILRDAGLLPIIIGNAGNRSMIPLLTILAVLPIAPADGPDPKTIAALVAAHNRERAAKDLAPLTSEPKLAEAARLHAEDMASRATMSHTGGDGSSPADRVKRAGYTYLTTGENVAKGQTTVAAVMRGWMDSPHHRDNILGDFSEIGVARALDADGAPYWCAVFGRPFPKYEPAVATAELAILLNKAREAEGKPTLEVDPRLASAARAIARDLASRGTLKPDPKEEEKAPPLPSLADRLSEAKYAYQTVSQAAFAGNPTPEAVIKDLLAPEALKANALGDFTDLGIGYAPDPDGRPFWCLLFAKPAKP